MKGRQSGAEAEPVVKRRKQTQFLPSRRTDGTEAWRGGWARAPGIHAPPPGLVLMAALGEGASLCHMTEEAEAQGSWGACPQPERGESCALGSRVSRLQTPAATPEIPLPQRHISTESKAGFPSLNTPATGCDKQTPLEVKMLFVRESGWRARARFPVWAVLKMFRAPRASHMQGPCEPGLPPQRWPR